MAHCPELCRNWHRPIVKQSAYALARQVKPVGSGLLVDFPRAAQDVLEQDPTGPHRLHGVLALGSFVLGNGQLPAPPAQLLIPTGELVLRRAAIGKPRAWPCWR